MILNTLFVLYSVFPAVLTSTPTLDPAPSDNSPPVLLGVSLPSAPSVEGIGLLSSAPATVRFPDAVVVPAVPQDGFAGPRARYPGAVVVSTQRSKDRAYAIANRLSEIGLTVMMYQEEDFATYRLRLADAKTAIDSMRRRGDVRPEEVGIVTLDEAGEVIPDVAADTLLGFAIAASNGISLERMETRFLKSRAATLLVQGVSRARAEARMTDDAPRPGIVHSIAVSYGDSGLVGSTVATDYLTPNVSLWIAPKDDVAIMGEAKSRLGAMVITWVREQVHAVPITQQPQGMIIN